MQNQPHLPTPAIEMAALRPTIAPTRFQIAIMRALSEAVSEALYDLPHWRAMNALDKLDCLIEAIDEALPGGYLANCGGCDEAIGKDDPHATRGTAAFCSECVATWGDRGTPLIAFADFAIAWPTTTTDDCSRSRAAWDALAPEDRAAAVNAIPAFKARMEECRRPCPAGNNYLSRKRWRLLTKALASGAEESA